MRLIAWAMGKSVPGQNELYQAAFLAGVYWRDNGQVRGEHHAKLAQFIGQRLDLPARAVRKMTVADIREGIVARSFFVASVTSEIRERTEEPPVTNRGHLILVYGVDDSGFYIHNSTGLASSNSQIHMHVPFERFAACFSGNGILVAGGQK